MKPVTPNEILAEYKKKTDIPDIVFAIVNEMIEKNFKVIKKPGFLDEKSSCFNVHDIRRSLKELANFKEEWMKFYDEYEKSGWSIQFISARTEWDDDIVKFYIPNEEYR